MAMSGHEESSIVRSTGNKDLKANSKEDGMREVSRAFLVSGLRNWADLRTVVGKPCWKNKFGQRK